jgi:CubicO group peptidase (beta-lactamase class C family)
MEDTSTLLTDVLEETQVPSLAAAVVFGREVRAAGAVGVRKRGDETPVTLGDKYHIGSCTKAMTASLAGMLIERGLLSWDSSLSSIFPELPMHPDYAPVTLAQLLTHTGGLPANPHYELWNALWEAEGAPQDIRANLLLPGVLGGPPEQSAGEYLYSNAGYTLAGAMLERVAGIPFETLLARDYFEPLGMTTAGFGAPATLGQIDQPYGHAPDPVDPEPHGDNPPFMSPAGTVHMSILDFAKHASFHLTGEPELMKRETLERLHTPVAAAYACGWGTSRTGGELTLSHGGSNTMFLALIEVSPAKNRAIVCATNVEPEAGERACLAALRRLRSRYPG